MEMSLTSCGCLFIRGADFGPGFFSDFLHGLTPAQNATVKLIHLDKCSNLSSFGINRNIFPGLIAVVVEAPTALELPEFPPGLELLALVGFDQRQLPGGLAVTLKKLRDDGCEVFMPDANWRESVPPLRTLSGDEMLRALRDNTSTRAEPASSLASNRDASVEILDWASASGVQKAIDYFDSGFDSFLDQRAGEPVAIPQPPLGTGFPADGLNSLEFSQAAEAAEAAALSVAFETAVLNSLYGGASSWDDSLGLEDQSGYRQELRLAYLATKRAPSLDLLSDSGSCIVGGEETSGQVPEENITYPSTSPDKSNDAENRQNQPPAESPDAKNPDPNATQPLSSGHGRVLSEHRQSINRGAGGVSLGRLLPDATRSNSDATQRLSQDYWGILARRAQSLNMVTGTSLLGHDSGQRRQRSSSSHRS